MQRFNTLVSEAKRFLCATFAATVGPAPVGLVLAVDGGVKGVIEATTTVVNTYSGMGIAAYGQTSANGSKKEAISPCTPSKGAGAKVSWSVDGD